MAKWVVFALMIDIYIKLIKLSLLLQMKGFFFEGIGTGSHDLPAYEFIFLSHV